MLSRLKNLDAILSKEPDRQPTFEEIRGFVTDFMNYSKQMNEMTAQMNKIRDDLFQALKEQGIDIFGQGD